MCFGVVFAFLAPKTTGRASFVFIYVCGPHVVRRRGLFFVYMDG